MKFNFTFVLISALLFAFSAQAGTITIDLGSGTPITITTNAAQEAAIQKLTGIENQRRLAQTPPLPLLTREEYVRSVLVSAFQSYILQARQHFAREACEKYKSLTKARQDAIKAELDGKEPCA